MEPKYIYTSRKKGLLLFLGSCVFICLGVAIVLFPERISVRYSETVAYIVGVICTVFFIGCAIAALKIIIYKKIVLQIDAKGITINPERKNEAVLHWDEISGFRQVNVATQKFIAVLLYNPDKRIDTEPNGITKRLLIYNLKHYGSPYCFSANAYDTNHNTLLNMLNEAWLHYTHISAL